MTGTMRTLLASALALVALLAVWRVAVVLGGLSFATRKNPGNRSGIAHRPAPADFRRGKLSALPTYHPKSPTPFQVDLRGYDLSGLDLSGQEKDLLFADFDDRTKWPASLQGLSSFEPGKIMALGKNPGLQVRRLHQQGITGSGVGVAIIDQPLLVDHVEYQNQVKLYEEIHCLDEPAQMHGPAVASIAVGKSVGVAPQADLYYIAETHGTSQEGEFLWDFTYLAQSIDRLLEINRSLPGERKIRVISISVGWAPQQKGYQEVVQAVERAKQQGIFVVSSSLAETYPGLPAFNGLGRDPRRDPDTLASYEPGLFWTERFLSRNAAFAKRLKALAPHGMLLVPMDSRCTASPTGARDYVFYRSGGWSWSIPYLAGIYALACQVRPDLTPEKFLTTAIATGDKLERERDGKRYVLGKVINPAKLIEAIRGRPGSAE
jgi:hypothetical protein